MKIGIAVNVLGSPEGGQTTYRLAAELLGRGHETWLLSAGRFSLDADDRIRAQSRTVTPELGRTSEELARALAGPRAQEEWRVVDDLDVLLLRSNPSVQRPWAQLAGIEFGRIAARRGVIVLNDPDGLGRALNKLYLQSFPVEVRPRTVITRSPERIHEFAEREGRIIVKPLQGSGGKGVFLVRPQDLPNLPAMIESISRDGYVVAQEYLPLAEDGDIRLFLLNGRPLEIRGHYAAFRRVRSGGDVRSNIHAGGRLRRAQVDAAALSLAEMVRPKLVEDGMFLVGLDIVGDKLMEVNVFSPGGLGSAQKLEKIDFTPAVVDAIERKVETMRLYHRTLSNLAVATY